MHPGLHLQQWLFCDVKALESNASNYRVPPVPSGSSETPNKLRLRLLLGWRVLDLAFPVAAMLAKPARSAASCSNQPGALPAVPWSYIWSTFMSTQA